MEKPRDARTVRLSGEGRGVGWVRADYQMIFGNIRTYALSIIISIRTLSLNAKACFVLQTTFVLLSILFSFKYISFQIGLASIHRFLNKSLPCK